MIDFNQRADWSEFDWEIELRKDDARVAAYISELSRYIDLPDEDGVILNSMKKRPELAPAGGDWSEIGPAPVQDGDPEDDDAPDPHENDWQNADGGFIHTQCAGFARDWAVLFASMNDPQNSAAFMQILCIYGKLMARSTDLIDMALEEADGLPAVPAALKIASCKRLLNDINDLFGEFDKPLPAPASERAAAHREAMGNVRNNVIDLLLKYRKQASSGKK